MRKFLLDTGIANALINNRLGMRQRVQSTTSQGHRVGICMPVLGELVAGAELSNNPLKNARRVLQGVVSLHLWPFDWAAAHEFGRLFAHLRRTGGPMQQIDIQIAAVALTLKNCVVVSTDSDFHAIPGLKVEDWTKPS